MKSSIAFPTPQITQSLVAAIHRGDPGAEEDLYRLLRRQFLAIAIRNLHTDAEDCIHDLFIAVLKGLRAHAIREPLALWAYARQVLTRKMLDSRRKRSRIEDSLDFDYRSLFLVDPGPDPEDIYRRAARLAVLDHVLDKLRPKEREILTRFYFEGQQPMEIESSMQLTHTQFRLLKSRSKHRLEGFVKNAIASRSCSPKHVC